MRLAPLDAARAGSFVAAVQTTAAKSAVRLLVDKEGTVESTLEEPLPGAWLRARGLVDKVFFVDRDDTAGIELLGESYGEALGRAEQERLVGTLSSGPVRTFGLASLTDRLLAARAELAKRGALAVVFLVPDSWELTGALEREGQFTRALSRQAGPIGELAGSPVYDVGQHDLAWAVVAGKGNIHLRQYGPGSGGEVTAQVHEIDDALASQLVAEGTTVAGDPAETILEHFKLRVLIEVSEALEFRVDPPQLLRIGLPTDVRPRRPRRASTKR